MSTESRKGSAASRANLLKRKEELGADLKKIEDDLAAAHDAELKGLVAAFKQHLAQNQFSLDDALKLLGAAGRSRGKRRGPKAAPKDKYVAGTTYKHPKSGETWIAKQRGASAKWLRDLVASTGKRYEDFAVKK